MVLFAFCGPAIFKKVSNSLGCGFLVSSADFRLCLHKFCGEADRGRLAGQRREFKTYRKSAAQQIAVNFFSFFSVEDHPKRFVMELRMPPLPSLLPELLSLSLSPPLPSI